MSVFLWKKVLGSSTSAISPHSVIYLAAQVLHCTCFPLTAQMGGRAQLAQPRLPGKELDQERPYACAKTCLQIPWWTFFQWLSFFSSRTNTTTSEQCYFMWKRLSDEGFWGEIAAKDKRGHSGGEMYTQGWLGSPFNPSHPPPKLKATAVSWELLVHF